MLDFHPPPIIIPPEQHNEMLEQAPQSLPEQQIEKYNHAQICILPDHPVLQGPD